MKKVILFILLALLPVVASAYDAEIDGIYYNFSGDAAQVTYKSNINNMIYVSDYSGSVVIPASVTYNDKTYSVTSISSHAFSHSSATSVTIPESVTIIEDEAFNDCKLRNVLIKCATPPSGSTHPSSGFEFFSDQTYYHATLYVPTGAWDAYAYDDNWYRFINIRETVITEDEVSMQQAYTLMDAETFAYSIYDPVNDCIDIVNSVSGINEDNPNHSWQMIEADGMHFLYNIGAKKFVAPSANGSYTLSSQPVPVSMADGDNGIILGTQTAKQWALVSNERMSVEQAIITGIDDLKNISDERGSTIVNLAGQRLSKPAKGINIVDGKKVLVK